MYLRTKWLIVIPSLLLLSFLGAVAADATGHIYGTLETSSGKTYKGFMRWGTEEAFWDDLFNSSKKELPYLDRRPEGSRERRRIKVFGVTVGYHWDDSASSRQFVARFGDIREIRPLRGSKAEVEMKSGTVYLIDGASNDVDGKIYVEDDALGEVTVDWDRVEFIRFSKAPSGSTPSTFRLRGTVETDDHVFEGFIQWDLQECVSTDKLDGETDDGELSIEMGKIRAIEKRNRKGSRVELKDGRALVLEDTNDVDNSLRGIFVEDERYGRVEIPWEVFQRAEFKDAGPSGRGYDDYKSAGPLHGSVTDYEGSTYTGPLIFDLDESEDWELLDGFLNEVQYSIPFSMIRSIEPSRGDTSTVVLKNGTELELGDAQDVAERNDGVMVLRENGREAYIPWRDVKKIVLD